MDNLNHHLEAIYFQNRRQLFACALAVTRCPELAEDAIHDAFCRLAGRQTQAEDPRAYVFRAVCNAAVDQLRRQTGMVELPEDGLFDPGPGPGDLASVYTRKQKGTEKDSWDPVSVPFITAAVGEKHQHHESLTILQSFTIYDDNLFYLWRKEVNATQSSRGSITINLYCKLPLLGPLYAAWTDGAGTHRGLFPKLFCRRTYPGSLKTIF